MIWHFYPDDWLEISSAIKRASDYTCTACGRQCRQPGEPYRGWDYELHVAHITQDYHAPMVQVAALCARCHLAHDAPLVWVARRRAEHWRQRMAGQMSLDFAARG